MMPSPRQPGGSAVFERQLSNIRALVEQAAATSLSDPSSRRGEAVGRFRTTH